MFVGQFFDNGIEKSLVFCLVFLRVLLYQPRSCPVGGRKPKGRLIPPDENRLIFRFVSFIEMVSSPLLRHKNSDLNISGSCLLKNRNNREKTLSFSANHDEAACCDR